jgi:putative transposase
VGQRRPIASEKGRGYLLGREKISQWLAQNGDRREEIFRDDRDRSKFLGYLAEGAERYRIKVYCYVLMENHFHLVVMTPEGNLSQWMHQLKTAYTVYFNRRHQVVGHLFQGRFKSTVIEAEKYLLGVSRYLHLNSVRGVVLGQGTPMERRKRLREYRWSSYRGYAGLEKMKSFLDVNRSKGSSSPIAVGAGRLGSIVAGWKRG